MEKMSRKGDGWYSSKRKCQKKRKKTQRLRVEPARRDMLPTQDRNKHHCRCHRLRESRYHSTCVFWIDVEPGECDPRSFEVSKIRTRLLRPKLEVSKKGTKLLRHDRSVLRKEDGGVEFKILAPMFAGWKRCQERETDGILHSRESYVRTSTQAAGLRCDEAQNCSLQSKLESTSAYSALGQFGSCSEKGIDVLSNKI